MNFMKAGYCVFLAAVGLVFSSRAQVPPAEQLLPDDTFGVVTIPDWTKLRQAQNQSAFGQLWNDPAMKPFRDNFVSNFQADLVKPLERELGVELAPYQELLGGQITLALLPPKEGATQFASLLLLMDAKDKGELLTAKLAELRKKWTESGKEARTQRIRDVEFSQIAFSRQDIDKFLQKVFPSSEPDDEEEEAPANGEKIELLVGQFKSLLIVSDSAPPIEKVLARQGGGLVPPLAEKAAYQKSHAKLFRDSMAHGWLNIQPIYARLLKFAEEQNAPGNAEPGMPQMNMSKILPALGLGSLQTVAGKIGFGPDGSTFSFFAAIPEAQREGLFRLLTLEKKDAAPPAFVPADAVRFQRTRLDARKAWTTIEDILNKVDPSLAGFVQIMLSTAGKDQDPNFDLKKNLIGNLGDDFIQYEKLPKSTELEDLAAAPSIFLVGSPNAPALLDAFRMITSLLPPPLSSAPMEEREFLGRKIYSLAMSVPQAAPPEEGDEAPASVQQTLSFTTSGGYVAITTDTPVLEEFLRSSENPPKPLRAVNGLAEAAQKTLGMDAGFFSYDNQAESMRLTLELAKKNPEEFSQSLFMAFGRGDSEAFNRYFNIELLPAYDRIAKYFGFVVTTAGTTQDGLVLEALAPRPAGLAR